MMTAEEFKAQFRVGDVIRGRWATGKLARITAIGKERFLFDDPFNRQGKREQVSVMALTGKRPWVLVDRPEEKNQRCCCAYCGNVHDYRTDPHVVVKVETTSRACRVCGRYPMECSCPDLADGYHEHERELLAEEQ